MTSVLLNSSIVASVLNPSDDRPLKPAYQAFVHLYPPTPLTSEHAPFRLRPPPQRVLCKKRVRTQRRGFGLWFRRAKPPNRNEEEQARVVAQGQQAHGLEKAQAVVMVVCGKAAGVRRLAPGREEGNRLRRHCLRGGRRSRTPRAAACIFGTRCVWCVYAGGLCARLV